MVELVDVVDFGHRGVILRKSAHHRRKVTVDGKKYVDAEREVGGPEESRFTAVAHRLYLGHALKPAGASRNYGHSLGECTLVVGHRGGVW